MQQAMNHMEEMEMASSTSPLEKTKQFHKPPMPSNNKLVLPAHSEQGANSTLQSPMGSPLNMEKNGHAADTPKTAKVFEIQTLPNGKTRTSLKTMNRRKFSQQKEKKATQMLAIVLGKDWLNSLLAFTGILQTSENFLGSSPQHLRLQVLTWSERF